MAIESATMCQLVRLAVEDTNQEAVERLIELNRPRLVRVVMRWTRNVHDAEDISQIALTKAHQSLATFQIETNLDTNPDEVLERQFIAWLDRIAFRSSVDFVRRNKRHQTVQVDTVDEFLAMHDPAGKDDPNLQDACELFSFAKLHLNQKQYASLYFCYVDGLSAAAIAAKMKSSPIAIRALLFRARRALKSAIRKHGFDHE